MEVMTNRKKTNLPDLHELPHADHFWETLREDAHKLIALGYKKSLAGIDSDDHEETDITGFIAKALREQLRDFKCHIWFSGYCIQEESPQEGEGLRGKRRPKTDLIIECTKPGRAEYIFEAKRLRKHGFEAGKYIGSEGMGCFISGKYASRYNEAAMLGYVQSDNPQYWKKKVREAIDKNKTNLNLVSSQQDVEVIPDFSDEWKSVHGREGIGRSIAIHHILLDYRPK